MDNSNINSESLESLQKDQLITLVLSLKTQMQTLNEDFRKLTNLRLYHLERGQFMHLQYSRRNSIEISGIPTNIGDKELEDEVVDVLREAKVLVNRQPVKKMDIEACHRLSNGSTTIVKMVNRKHAKQALFNDSNLKNTRRYGDGQKIYTNDSLCPEFKYLNFAIRKAYSSNNIARYKFRNGITYVKFTEQSDFVEIGHVLDLENLKIPLPSRKRY